MQRFLREAADHLALILGNHRVQQRDGLLASDLAKREDGGAAAALVLILAEILHDGHHALRIADPAKRRHQMQLDDGLGGTQKEHRGHRRHGLIGFTRAEDVDGLYLDARVRVGHRVYQDRVDFRILQIAEFHQFGDARCRVGVLEAELYVFDDFERRFLGRATLHIVNAGSHLPLMRHWIGTESAAQSLAAILRKGEVWYGKRDAKREYNK